MRDTKPLPEKSESKIFLPGGTPSFVNRTERQIERQREDEHFVPVIIKRSDQAVRHPDDTLDQMIRAGAEQHLRAPYSLLLSAIAAGLILGFSVMAVALVATALPPDVPPIWQRIAMAFVYPLGFVLCIMSGSQLFTEQTATAVYPCLDGKSRWSGLLRVWSVVIVGNLIGTLISSALIAMADPVVQAKVGYQEIGLHLAEVPTGVLLISSVLAGWLMAQGGWLVHSTPPATSQILSIYFVTFLIGIGGLHHSIAGSAEAFVAVMLTDAMSSWQAGRFISLALLGNLVGGSVFVAVLNYAHIRHLQQRRAA